MSKKNNLDVSEDWGYSMSPEKISKLLDSYKKKVGNFTLDFSIQFEYGDPILSVELITEKLNKVKKTSGEIK